MKSNLKWVYLLSSGPLILIIPQLVDPLLGTELERNKGKHPLLGNRFLISKYTRPLLSDTFFRQTCSHGNDWNRKMNYVMYAIRADMLEGARFQRERVGEGARGESV
jgi:hypothetical protein